MIPTTRNEWAAVVIAMALQAGLMLSIAVPEDVTGWAAFMTALLVAGLSPKSVIDRAKAKFGPARDVPKVG